MKEKKELKKLLKELDKMRITKNFGFYGLGKGGKNHKWLIKLKEIKQAKDVSINGLMTAKYIHSLALQYVFAGGAITPFSIELTQLINGHLRK